ncbi:MAG: SH3 domain-containing protein [Phototrophicaceae bacterium]
MKQTHLLKITLVTLFVMLSTVLASAQNGIVATVETEVLLRVGAGTDWRILESLPVGTTINLDGRESSGLWVRGITQNAQVGWVAARYLNIGPDAVFALPVIAREAPITVGAPAAGSVPVQQASAPAASEPANAPVAVSGGVTTTATATVNMRSGPGTDYRRIGAAQLNEQLTLDGRSGNLGWVRGVNSTGVVGWVSANYIALSFNEVSALPVVGIDTPFGVQVASAPSGATANTSAPNVAAPPPVTSNTTISGFGYGGHVTGLDDNSVNYMRIAGMSWAKFQVRYTQGADPNAVAGLINDTHAKGFRILLGVVGLPYELNNGGYFEAYAGYVGGLAALGADAIEVWNEPNLDREWLFGQIDPVMYTNLLAQSYNAIKSRNSNTYVISAALAPTGAEAAFPGAVVNDNSYLAGMVNAGALNYMDCVGAHYNEGIVPPTWNSGDPRSEYYTRYYNGMVDTYWGIVGGRRPLCFTELGYLTPEGFGPLPGNFSWASNVTVAQQASWLDQVMSMAARSGRVRIVIIWNINFQNYDADPMGGYALIRPDGSCPACLALGN